MRRNQRKINKIKSQKKEAKIILTIITIILLIICIYTIKNISSLITETKLSKNKSRQVIAEETVLKNDIKTEIIEEKPITFTLTSLGDTLCHNTQYWDAYNNATKEYDFSYVYEDISNYTLSSDLTIGSLETSFAGEDRGYSNYPTFNSPDSLATALKNIGVDIISTAGNHALDYGYSGLCRTIDVLEKNGLSHLGTYKTADEQEKILIKNVKGVNIAFLNYSYGTNGIPVPTDKTYCINLIDRDLIKEHIQSAKKQNVDMIVACMHWGIEYQTSASSEQEELADFLFQNGVDVILGNHPHVLQPMEKRNITLDDGTKKEVFVVYALGNFTADQREEITRDSAILNLTITKQSDGKINIDKVDYIPIYMYKNTNSSKKFKILDIEKAISAYENGLNTSISSTLYNNLKVQLEKIKGILGDEIN